jgi:hypothetical protein
VTCEKLIEATPPPETLPVPSPFTVQSDAEDEFVSASEPPLKIRGAAIEPAPASIVSESAVTFRPVTVEAV